MSKVLETLSAGDAKPAAPKPVSDQAPVQIMAASGMPPDLDDGAGPGGPSLLADPSAPHYRRSLFRR